MKQANITLYLILLVSLVLSLEIAFETHASKITGNVVDEDGNPVKDIVINIESYKGKILHGRNQMRRNEPVFPPPKPSNTDASGAFTIEDLTSPSVNLLRLSLNRDSDYEIQTLEMQGLRFRFFPHQFHWFNGFPFGIEEETDEIKVKISVRYRMRIQGQVFNADGTPLSNANVSIMVKHRNKTGSGSGSSSGTNTLDENGGFIRYVDSAAYYTVSVTYQGKTVQSNEVFLEQGQRLDGLSLTFGENIKKPKPNIPEQHVHVPPDPERLHAALKRREEGVWAINPANRHAYKMIQCESPEDAIEKAKAQNAHLIAINDEEEQQWILSVFGKKNYWIGFTTEKKEKEKKWDNGDQFTHTNWDLQNLIPDSDKESENEQNSGKLYAVLIGVTGKWQQIRENNPVSGLTKRAILERKDLIIGIPQPDEGLE